MERRQYHRISFSADARLCVDKHVSAVQLIDISLNGALLELNTGKHTFIDQPCTLTIQLREGEDQIHMQGYIAHSQGKQLGFKCDHIDIDSVTELRRLIELNLADEESMQRDLRALVG